MYDGAIYVGGKVASLGIDCVEGELTPDDDELLDRKLRIYGMEPNTVVPEVRLREEALELRQPRAGRAQARSVEGPR